MNTQSSAGKIFAALGAPAAFPFLPGLPLYAGQTLADGDFLLLTPGGDIPVPAEKAARVFCYGRNPDEAYAARMRAYEMADICLTAHPETAERLALLHPRVLLAGKEDMADARRAFHALDAALKHLPRELPPLPAPHAVVFVVRDFSVGGLETVVINLMRTASRQGWRPLLTYEGSIAEESARRLQAENLEFFRLPGGYAARVNLLREVKAELVNAHYATLLYRECREAGIPFMQTIHNMYIWLRGEEAGEWREMDAFTAAYAVVSAGAARVADCILGLPPAKMIIIPNGSRFMRAEHSSAAKTRALRRRLSIPVRGKIFVSVASITRAKGQLLLAHALARALQRRDDLYAVFLGATLDPEYAGLLNAAVTALGIAEHVRMPGCRDDVPVFLDAAAAAVFPSFYEGWSLAISEAIACGVPVIASDVGGAAEQLRGIPDARLIPAPLPFERGAMPDLRLLADGAWQNERCGPLALALLDAAARPPSVRKAPPVFPDADSAGGHLRIMDRAARGTPFADLRAAYHIPQRQNLCPLPARGSRA
jgi:glycosyltransferase involved in cell wall biosynthesis